MMVFTTIFIAAIVIAAVYFVAVRRIPWPILSYALMLSVGGLCFLPGGVHFAYIGIEVIGLDLLLVWLHYRFTKRPA